MEKVFVLVCDSVIRGEQSIKVTTFSSRAKAVKLMCHQFNVILNDWNGWTDCVKVEESENARCIYEEGYYIQNHIAWEIHEQVVL